MQLNKSEALFHVFLAALLHTLYIALFLPAMSFIFNFCGIKTKIGEKKNIGQSLSFLLELFHTSILLDLY